MIIITISPNTSHMKKKNIYIWKIVPEYSGHTPARYFKTCFATEFNYCLFQIFLPISRCYLKSDKWRLLIFSLLIPFTFSVVSMNNTNLLAQSQILGITFGLGFIPDFHIQVPSVSLPSEASILGWDESVSEHVCLCTLIIPRQQKHVVRVRLIFSGP